MGPDLRVRELKCLKLIRKLRICQEVTKGGIREANKMGLQAAEESK